MARRNSFLLLIKPSATIVLVIVVPILAPMIMGMALRIETEEEATKATTSEVVVELLWIMAVSNKPMKRPVNGFEVAWIMVCEAEPLRCCSEAIIRSTANMKTIREARIYNAF